VDYEWNNINVSQPTKKTMIPELKKDLLFGFQDGVYGMLVLGAL